MESVAASARDRVRLGQLQLLRCDADSRGDTRAHDVASVAAHHSSGVAQRTRCEL
jgi:hypothetical protein